MYILFMMVGLLIIVISSFIYSRYFPVWGVDCLKSLNVDGESIDIVDVRDYHQSTNKPIRKAVNIPIAYMKRHYQDIKRPTVHVVASNTIEKNMSVRFLRKKGFKVASYTLTDCDCK
ncbi:hypothetical protein [Metabacillus malikii]|uniref:Rhodanese-related sulfurtransferase n=1 Tax=Metabacillus malikii TaxID=1504265 RepID=A0ABT9ZEN6_9BACI|nr:hypothetical protein [Metabacillus malikii]MDQ0230716.1 rhodanese-related sulfurtransferase [Metabacillus malikii]